MCSPNIQVFANKSIANITGGTSSLIGAGSSLLLTATTALGAIGTVVQSITIKSTASTTLGMIRFFLNDGVNYFLFREVMVPANSQTGVVQSFSYTFSDPIMLQPGYTLYVSTQNTEPFNVVATGQDLISCGC